MSDRAARSRSFESVAADYERHRPEYPDDAVRWAAQQLGLELGARVLDVGAGTGKLTRGLVASGFEVVAVEPGGPMLAELREAVPEAEAHQAPAEAIPLPGESVEAAFAGQAFHWFDRERALPELHRVIAPGGGLALLWNWWDERDPLQRELGELVGFRGHVPYREEALPGESVDAAFAGQAYHWFDRERALPELHRMIRPGGGLALLWNWWDERDPLQRELGPVVGYAGHRPFVEEELPGAPWFRELGRTVVESAEDSGPEALVSHFATTSMFLTMEPGERERRLAELREIASRYGDRFAVPRQTFVFAFDRLS